VRLDRRLRHVELVGDLLVQQARAQHAEHAELLRREFGDATRDAQVVVAPDELRGGWNPGGV